MYVTKFKAMKVIILGIFLSTSLISFSQENSEKKSETNKVVKKEKPKTRTVKAKFDKKATKKRVKADFGKDDKVPRKKEKSKTRTVKAKFDKDGNVIKKKKEIKAKF